MKSSGSNSHYVTLFDMLYEIFFSRSDGDKLLRLTLYMRTAGMLPYGTVAAQGNIY
jgi:hypothetical protein